MGRLEEAVRALIPKLRGVHRCCGTYDPCGTADLNADLADKWADELEEALRTEGGECECHEVKEMICQPCIRKKAKELGLPLPAPPADKGGE